MLLNDMFEVDIQTSSKVGLLKNSIFKMLLSLPLSLASTRSINSVKSKTINQRHSVKLVVIQVL